MEPLWAYVKKNWLALAAAFVPTLASLAIWNFGQRELLELTATALADVPVVSVRREYGGEIEVHYRGDVVDDLRVVEIEIENTGNRPIERSAFDSPVTFDFGSGQITEVMILRVRPPSLKPQLRVRGRSVTLEPLLLNPHEAFVFRSFLIGGGTQSNPITVSGRVRGISEIPIRDAFSGKAAWPTGLVVLTLGGSLSLVLVVCLGMKAWQFKKRYFEAPAEPAALREIGDQEFEAIVKILQRSLHSFQWFRDNTDLQYTDEEFEALAAKHSGVLERVRVVNRDDEKRRADPGRPGMRLTRQHRETFQAEKKPHNAGPEGTSNLALGGGRT